MRPLPVLLLSCLLPSGLAGQETVALEVHLMIPELLRLEAEPPTVAHEDGRAVTEVRLHVSANHSWTLLVGCGVGVQPLEGENRLRLDESASSQGWWRTPETSESREPCASEQPAAEGSRGNRTLVLEYSASAAEPIRYRLVPR